jgi:Fe-S-cluster containining protein
MGRIRLQASDEQRCYDEALGRFTDDEAIPCFRCGVCCERWQPLVGPVESRQLAAYQGLAVDAFLARYARPYPFAEETYQLRERPDGGCIFLTTDDNGHSGCSVHPARPQACRDWDASLLRKECRDGLRRLPPGFDAIRLYDDPDDLRALVARLRGPLPMGRRGG